MGGCLGGSLGGCLGGSLGGCLGGCMGGWVGTWVGAWVGVRLSGCDVVTRTCPSVTWLPERHWKIFTFPQSVKLL